MSILAEVYFLILIHWNLGRLFQKLNDFLGVYFQKFLFFSCMIHCQCVFLLKSAVKVAVS